ncbi:MAG: hypothetical protein A3J37_09170 [Alphaproteobacteria bacterium RIFCSPHIGHO2_12_FULL_45_9]|nr:MAG: hypothetical protein A3B66_01140 [Alphaproteobacteria bacterium RIFCSPHIGHO2_02_FULL_46_13]OFW95592.1 MAG: hypothetical protein A3J37_09170 [Alphaproteobacteria bacterium RIFCSPHIGHO2_12_FULL_45_9]
MEKLKSGHICYNNPLMLEPIALEDGRPNPNFRLSVRTKNCLLADHVLYVATLTSLTNRQLLNVSGLGKSGYHEVIDLLSSHALKPEMFPSVRLNTEDEIRDFCSINIKPTPQSKPVLKQSWPYIEIKLSLPIDEINGFTDEEVIAVVQPDCQKHFERAVKVKALEELSAGNQELYQMYIDQISMQMSDWCSGDKLREIAVPVAPPECLSVTFKQAVLNEVAKDLGGLVLYSSLGASLDSLNVR